MIRFEAFNRKLVDGDSIRLYMVSNPKKLTVKNLSITSVEVSNHPVNDMGKRKIDVDGNFYISGEDVHSIKKGEQIRLLGLGEYFDYKTGGRIRRRVCKRWRH